MIKKKRWDQQSTDYKCSYRLEMDLNPSWATSSWATCSCTLHVSRHTYATRQSHDKSGYKVNKICTKLYPSYIWDRLIWVFINLYLVWNWIFFNKRLSMKNWTKKSSSQSHSINGGYEFKLTWKRKMIRSYIDIAINVKKFLWFSN